MAGYIVRGEDKKISISAQAIETLLRRADGDAALLFLFLQRTTGAVTPGEICKELQWNELQFNAAENALKEMGILEKKEPIEEAENLSYSQEDTITLMDSDISFSQLISASEERMGKRLRPAETQLLAALYDQMHMPADVIYTLISHCVEKCEKYRGPGSRPTMRQIQTEASYWIKLGIADQKAANRFLKDYANKQAQSAAYLQVLGIRDRGLVPTEQKYIETWMNQGFVPEVVALAYDKTVTRKGEMNWSYLNAILKNWHEKGLHTLAEIEAQEKPKKKVTNQGPSADRSWMSKYTKRGE